MAKRPAKPAKPAAKKLRAKLPAKAPAKIGRPSLYTPETAALILSRLADGEFLSHMCREEGLPSAKVVIDWTHAHPEFREAYARARELQAQAVAERGIKEALKAGSDLDPAAARVRFDALRWMAGRIAPRTYGDRPGPEPGTAENPLVVLMQQMRARALPIAHTPIDSTAEEIEE